MSDLENKQATDVNEIQSCNVLEHEDGCSGLLFSPIEITESVASFKDAHQTMITNLLSTTNRSSSSTSPMCSSGEQTVINVNVATSKQLPSNLSASNQSSYMNSKPVATSLPPVVLDWINKPFVGINFYEKMSEETSNINLDHVSGLFREVDKEFADENETDDQVLISTSAAKYVQRLVEETKRNDDMERELHQKLNYINELLVNRIEQIKASIENINLKDNSI